MIYAVSITSQGQLNIPVQVQRKLKLQKPGKAILKVSAGKMIVEPITDFLQLGGSLPTRKPALSSSKIHSLFAASLVGKQ